MWQLSVMSGYGTEKGQNLQKVKVRVKPVVNVL